MSWNTDLTVATGDPIVSTWGNKVRDNLNYLKGTSGPMQIDDALTVVGTIYGDGSGLTNLNPANLSAPLPLSKGGTGENLTIGAAGTVLRSTGAAVAFSTDGTSLSIDASKITTGTVPIARMPSFPLVALIDSTSPTDPGTAYARVFDTEVSDALGFHSTVSNTDRITIPASYGGTYYIYGGIAITKNSTSVTTYLARIMKNGSTELGSSRMFGIQGSVIVNQVACLAVLAAGDYLQLIHSRDSGESPAATLNGSTLNNYPRFFAFRLTP